MSGNSEFELVRRIVARDEAALSELYNRYGGLVYNLALRILRNTDHAEEVTQDVFLKAWNEAEKWNPERGNLAAWLIVITRSRAIDRLRREKGQVGLANLEAVPDVVDSSGPAHSTTWHDKHHLHDLLQELPDDQRRLIELAFLDGFTHSELAERLDIPLGTVKGRIRSGLKNLKDLWQSSGEKLRRND